ncbi:ribosome maturation factor RimP [Paraoerskovia marina]|uniref:ribosome maturation factor RimP n=1 Tax=Paraoerskovia marina TaxID=545619 RepID=UPI0004926A0B|nr:ribosome maturation factor RimP [Paraoerskovia marina]
MARHTDGEVYDLLAPVVVDAGLFLEEVRTSRAGSKSVVRVVVDLPEDELGSLDLDGVADVSRAISDALDETDVLPGAYTLEVGTPGTSRPLTTPRHFRRARGRLVRLDRRDGTSTTTRLVDVVDDVLHCVADGSDESTQIPLTDVAVGHVEVELKRAAEAFGADEEA